LLPQPRQDTVPTASLVRTKLEILKSTLIVSPQGFGASMAIPLPIENVRLPSRRLRRLRKGLSSLVCSKDDLKTRQPLSTSIESWSVVLLMSDSRRKACWYPGITKVPGPEPEPVRCWRPEHLANPATCISRIDTLRKPGPDGVDLLEQR
jgi:hypothetical protein